MKESKDVRIKKRVKVNFKIEVKTGLHIGGSKGIYGIGGVDSPVIKNPLNNEPIIPGSSIKGKVRMLLEVMKTSQEEINRINEAFGPKNAKENNPMTRVIFRDLMLTKESREMLQDTLGEGFFTEIKAENTINRAQGKATAPRFIERVPAGTIFEGEYIVQYLEEDKDDVYENLIDEGLKFLENNYLGGSGSRGYGKIKFTEINKVVL